MSATFNPNKLINAFEQVSFHSEKIIAGLLPANCWQQSAPNLCSIASSLNDYFYQDGDDGRVTSQCCAVIYGVSNAEAMELNEAKDNFKALITSYRAEHPKETNSWQRSLFATHSLARQSLSDAAHGRLNLKACWRRVRVIDEPVTSISYAWYNSGRSIKRIDYQQVIDRLEKLDRQGVNIQQAWSALAGISSNTELCIVQKQAPLIRANVRLGNGEMIAFNCSTPIFLTAQDLLPVIRPLPESERKTLRKSRSDQRIDNEPLIPILRVHRYLTAK
jgi:hypothetical protein